MYNGGIDQTGFAPCEFDARPENEQYAGGVHQFTPASGTNTKIYLGSALQLADAEWKVAQATGNYNNLYASAWAHYNFAKSAVGSSTGSGDWVNNTTLDPPFVGGFIDWVDTSSGAGPANWQRFVDTSGYMIIATEELAFSKSVDFSS